jgi:hypothetical protein
MWAFAMTMVDLRVTKQSNGRIDTFIGYRLRYIDVEIMTRLVRCKMIMDGMWEYDYLCLRFNLEMVLKIIRKTTRNLNFNSGHLQVLVQDTSPSVWETR